jgi:methyl-accepting chemotaxis protein
VYEQGGNTVGIINNMSVKGKLFLFLVAGLAVIIAALIVGALAETAVFVVVTVVGAVIWLIVVVMIIHSVLAEQDVAATYAKALAAGDLNINFKNNAHDAENPLEHSLYLLSGTLRGLNEDISNISSQSKEGEEVLNQVLGCLTDFEQGKFSTKMSPMSGRHEGIGSAINNLGNNLREFNDNLQKLMLSVAKGDLRGRIDSSIQAGGWGEITDSLNKLLDAVCAPMDEVIKTMEQASKGVFSKLMTGEYSGEFAYIKTAVNNTVTNTSKHIRDITAILVDLANKNLDVSIPDDLTGDFSAIKDAFEMIMSQFNDVMANINIASEQVAMGAKTISDSSMTLAEGANMQAASVDELTFTIKQVDERTASNSENAARAEILSGQSKDNAAKGNAEMKNMLIAMEEIKESSNNIYSIIRVISEIAFQTNLLALNASVEAARAGTAGKGFAVVAEEVRSLASRSDTAAKETSALIQESIDRVNQGASIATSTADVLERIVSDTDEVSAIISGIARESQEQSEAISQVNTGTSQIAEVIQRNSSTSQETAAAAEELSSQSEILREMISVFRLRKEDKRPPVINTSHLDEIVPSIPLEPAPKPAARPAPRPAPMPVRERPKVSEKPRPAARPAVEAKPRPAAPAPKLAPKPAPVKPNRDKPLPKSKDSHSDNLAAAYMAESKNIVADEPAKADVPDVKVSGPVRERPSAVPMPGSAQGVKAPSAAHIYDKPDYGKY